MFKFLLMLAGFITVCGCSEKNMRSKISFQDKDHSANLQSAKFYLQDQWLGLWVGTEGLALTVHKDEVSGPGSYLLKMKYGLDLDQYGIFKGRSKNMGIEFIRNGRVHFLHSGDGKSTGLKWLSNKENCLIVISGEGYCRD